MSSSLILKVRWPVPLCPTAASSQVSYASHPTTKSREKCLCFSVSIYSSNLLGTGMVTFPHVHYYFVERSLDFYRTIDRKTSPRMRIDKDGKRDVGEAEKS